VALLNNVCHLVREQLETFMGRWSVVPLQEVNVRTGGERLRANATGLIVFVDSDVGEVLFGGRFQTLTRSSVKRSPAPTLVQLKRSRQPRAIRLDRQLCALLREFRDSPVTRRSLKRDDVRMDV
jgi:hypothetical protein